MPKHNAEEGIPHIDELEAGLAIDQHDLDRCCSEQPDVYYRVSKALAWRESQRDAAERALEDTEARVDAEIRHSAEVHGDKITEKVVESQKRLNKEVMRARDALMELNLLVGELKALEKSFQQRHYMLRTLAELHISGYYSDPTTNIPAKVRDMRADKAKKLLAEGRRAKGYV